MRDSAPLEGNETENINTDGEVDWLGLVKSAYRSSTDYFNTNHRKQFEKNLSNFQSKHPAGSKYYGDGYLNRSRLFRPKTRVSVRKNEASLAAALFSGHDVVSLTAEDQDDPQKRRDASFWHSVLNYRLNKTIPWFKTAIGAFQEAQVYGIVASKQYWEYEEAVVGESLAVNPADPSRIQLDVNGDPILRPEMGVVVDRPRVKLVEIENIRFDSACDWSDPVNSSPYIIECIPMYVGDVMAKMESIDDKTGLPEWFKLTKEEIMSCGKDPEKTDDTTQQKRHQGEKETDHAINDFETVWVYEVIMREGGQDWLYYTLSINKMLSDPKPLEEVYWHGIRPYVFGEVAIEAHKSIPAGTVELSQDLQAESNDVVNQRLDNVKYTLNRRKYVQRGQNVDLASLKRGLPGGLTMMDDINAVKDENTRDISGSAYGEQNRLDSDFDDISGVFSVSSVQNNRQLNETVGGMQLMSQFANKDTEYLIRTFVETWVEPVMRQLVLLEQYYETDEHIIKMAQGKALESDQPTPPLPVEAGPNALPPPLPPEAAPLETPQNVDVRVNVGFGNLSPDQRINKVINGLKMMAEVAPWMVGNLNTEEVAQEIFGALGHKDASKFFTTFDKPQDPGPPPDIQVKQERNVIEQQRIQAETAQKQAKLELDYQLGMAELAAKEKMTVAQLEASLAINREKLAQNREIAGSNNLTKLAEVERKEQELNFKERTGRPGI